MKVLGPPNYGLVQPPPRDSQSSSAYFTCKEDAPREQMWDPKTKNMEENVKFEGVFVRSWRLCMCGFLCCVLKFFSKINRFQYEDCDFKSQLRYVYDLI